VGTCQGLAGGRSQRQPKPRGQIGGGGFGSPKISTNDRIGYVVDTSDSVQELLQFLDDEECEGLEATHVGISNNNNNNKRSSPLRGIFAKEAIQQGEYICAVPFVSTLLIDEEFVEEGERMEEELVSSSSGRIEHGLNFWNKFANHPDNQSFFRAYLDSLPKFSEDDPNFDATPEFWSDSEIRQLEVPVLVDDMLQRKQELHDLANQQQQQQQQQPNLDANTMKHAAWIVRSRAFTTLKKAMNLDGTQGLLQRTVLIPYFDFLNHCDDDVDSDNNIIEGNAKMKVIETKEYDESFYALVAKQFIPKGQEIRIVYGTGQETTLDLFAKYGFLPKGNTENDRQLLPDLDQVEWSTTLEEDEAMLSQSSSSEEELSRTMRTILNLRTYLKRLQRDYP
jgi:hypothetical protein